MNSTVLIFFLFNVFEKIVRRCGYSFIVWVSCLGIRIFCAWKKNLIVLPKVWNNSFWILSPLLKKVKICYLNYIIGKFQLQLSAFKFTDHRYLLNLGGSKEILSGFNIKFDKMRLFKVGSLSCQISDAFWLFKKVFESL